MSRAQLARRLDAGVQALGLSIDPHRLELMLDFLALLARWNRAYNLTAVDQPLVMVDRHLIDSLSIYPWLSGRVVLDAGTGAGLPGAVLAMADPGRRYLLVDSNGKKVRFLRQLRRELGLENIEPIQARIETFDPPVRPDTVVARALASLPELVDALARFIDDGARLLAMKGRLDEHECAAVADAYNIERIELDVPGTDAVRSLAIVSTR